MALPAPYSPPFASNAGMIFRYKNHREFELKRVTPQFVELQDMASGNMLQLVDEETKAVSMPTVEWLRETYKLGLLHSIAPEGETASARKNREDLVDAASCIAADPKVGWRYRLAVRAIDAGILRTDDACSRWLDTAYGAEDGDEQFKRPSGSALRRWMTAIRKGKKMACLVSAAGRKKGRSQLDPELDKLVHAAAMYWWAEPELLKAQAFEWLGGKVLEHNRKNPEHQLDFPSKETLRLRIKRLECYDTYATRYGLKAAEVRYRGNGDIITASRPLEVLFMDATTLEQAIVFDEDWLLPASKVRLVALMDLYTSAIVGLHLYTGPNRSETTIEAIISSTQPPNVPDRLLSCEPMLGWIFGKAQALLPDNELALIGPGTRAALEEAGFFLHLPPVEAPQCKAKIERWFRTLKQRLAHLPGTVIDPKRAQQIGLDAITSATLTFSQIRAAVEIEVAEFNFGSRKKKGEIAPVQIWKEHASRIATPSFQNRAEISRILGRTEEVLLTRDGIEYNEIRYRDAELCQAALNDMAHTDQFYLRKSGSGAVRVKARINGGNIDTIQFYNTLSNEWVELPSIQPDYTHKLSEYEHNQFRLAAKRRHEPYKTAQQRIESRARSLAEIDDLAPHLPFQRRRNLAAIYTSPQVRAISSVPIDSLPPADVALAHISTYECDRRDSGLPEPMPPREQKVPKKHLPPQRPTGMPAIDRQSAGFDWDAVEATPGQPAQQSYQWDPDMNEDDDHDEE